MKYSSTPDCSTCNVPEDTYHVITHCKRYNTERQLLKAALNSISDTPFCFKKLFQTWNSAKHEHTAFNALTKFLTTTGIAARY